VSGLGTSKKSISAYQYKKGMIIHQKLSETKHQVRCCRCPANTAAWGPYPPSYTTTSVFLRHFEKFHKDLPRSQEIKDEILSWLQNKRQRTEDTSWSLATKATSGHRPPDESFISQALGSLHYRDEFLIQNCRVHRIQQPYSILQRTSRTYLTAYSTSRYTKSSPRPTAYDYG
jgi:hypothetical protein